MCVCVYCLSSPLEKRDFVSSTLYPRTWSMERSRFLYVPPNTNTAFVFAGLMNEKVKGGDEIYCRRTPVYVGNELLGRT